MTNNDKKKKGSLTMIYTNYVLLVTNSVIISYKTHIQKDFKTLQTIEISSHQNIDLHLILGKNATIFKGIQCIE